MDEAEWPLVTGEDLLQDLAALPRELQGPAPTGDDDAYSQEEVARFVAHLAQRGLLPLPPAPLAPRTLQRAISASA